MQNLRFLLLTIVVVLLSLGWLASVQAVFTGAAIEYHKKVDQPAVAMLALVLFLAALAAWLIPDRSSEQDEDDA